MSAEVIQKSARKKRNRSYGKRSPLDKLPEAASRELRRLCAASTTLREIQAWLKRAHSCQISQQSISDWWIRKQADEREAVLRCEAKTTAVTGGLRITVTTSDTTEVRLEIRSVNLRDDAEAPN